MAINKRGLTFFDCFWREGLPFEPFRISGVWCMEFAIRVMGATQLELYGYDGYSSQESNYFDGVNHSKPQDLDGKTVNVIQPATQAIVSKYPHVEFVCRGFQPRYEITGDNWIVTNS